MEPVYQINNIVIISRKSVKLNMRLSMRPNVTLSTELSMRPCMRKSVSRNMLTK